MMTNKRIALVHTNSNEKNLTLENFEKKQRTGVFIKRCPQTGKEIIFRWVGIKERNEARIVCKEINEEYKLRMAS